MTVPAPFFSQWYCHSGSFITWYLPPKRPMRHYPAHLTYQVKARDRGIFVITYNKIEWKIWIYVNLTAKKESRFKEYSLSSFRKEWGHIEYLLRVIFLALIFAHCSDFIVNILIMTININDSFHSTLCRDWNWALLIMYPVKLCNGIIGFSSQNVPAP